MKADDLSKVLFDQFRQVYSEEREPAHEGEQKRRKLQDSEEAFMETTRTSKRRETFRPRMQELPTSSSDVAQYIEVHMEIDMILRNDTGRYAWDDVNNMELHL